MDTILEKKKIDELDETKTGTPGETVTPTENEPIANEVPELNNTPVPEKPEEPVDELPQSTPVVEEKEEITELNSTEPEGPQPRMFSQEEVNELMGQVRAETRDRTFKYIYGRYGVENEDGLDDLIGNAQRYDTLKENTDAERHSWDEERKGFKAHEDEYHNELCELKEKIALMESGIDKDRYEDAKFILKGKGLEITPETIANELATHPEWKTGEEKKPYIPENPQPNPEIKVPEVPNILGNESSNLKAPEKSEEEIAMNKYFRIK